MSEAIKKNVQVLFLSILLLFYISGKAVAYNNFEIHIPCKTGTSVYAVFENGNTYNLGTVIKIPKTSRYPSYTASAWGTPGTVCASAVNAIHILQSVKNNQGRTISIVPRETIAPAAGTNAAFVISTKAGYGPFGLFSPFVGSEVFVKDITGKIKKLDEKTKFRNTDLVIISVKARHTDNFPYMAEIENKPGGRVTIWDKNGYRVIARTIKPVLGTGRFAGTKFQTTSRLRANHCGVIDYSTTPSGETGGFQIVPWEHSLTSKEMQNLWNLTQWMVIAPVPPENKLKATFPLFKGALVPSGTGDEKTENRYFTYGRKSLLLVRYKGGAWSKIDNISGRKDYALKNITHLRIYFLFSEE